MELPYRLERLKTKLETMNGNEPTAAESRKLTVMIGEALVDLWVDIIHQRQRSVSHWFVENVLPTLVSTGIIALIGWLLLINNKIQIPVQ